MSDISSYKKAAIYAVKKAGAALVKEFNNRHYQVKYKSKHEIVTTADIVAENYILKTLKKNFPDHAILSEESGFNHKNSKFLWVVDPLDGTTNFFMHNPLFAVSLALWCDQKIILGVVYAPYLNELFWAQEGKGAYLKDKPLKVSSRRYVDTAILTYCHGSTQKDIARAVNFYNFFKLKKFDIRQLGAASLELCYVAAGYTDSIMIPGANSWDVSAGVLLVRQAGGEVTDFKGKQWNLKSKDMLASNGKIHPDLVASLKKY